MSIIVLIDIITGGKGSFNRIKKILEYSIILRLGIICYLDLFISIFLAFGSMNISTGLGIASSVLSMAMFSIGIYFPVLIFKLILKPRLITFNQN